MVFETDGVPTITAIRGQDGIGVECEGNFGTGRGPRFAQLFTLIIERTPKACEFGIRSFSKLPAEAELSPKLIVMSIFF